MTTQPDLASLRLPQRHAASARPEAPPPPSHWKTRILLPGAIVLTFVVLLAYGLRDAIWPATPVRAIEVVPRRGEAGATRGRVVLNAAGWLEPDPYPYYVTALADGVVEQVLVLEGESVRAGQPVARMVDEDAKLAADRAAASVQQHQARLAAAQAEQAAAQEAWDARIESTRRLETAEAELAEAKAQRRRLDHERDAAEAALAEMNDLVPRLESDVAVGAIAEIELIRARFARKQRAAELEAARGRLAEAEARIARLTADATAARKAYELRTEETRRLAAAKAGRARAKGELAEAQAILEEARLRLERMTLRAPRDGVVMTRLAAPGAKLRLSGDRPWSAHVLHLYDPDEMQVRVDVPLADAAGVGVGQQAEVVVEVLPNQVFDGRVVRVVHQADVQKNTLEVKVALDAPSAHLKPEMLARVRFLSMPREGEQPDESRLALFAPARLVERTGQNSGRAWVLVDGDRVERRELTLSGAEADGWLGVSAGLQVGDRIVDPGGADLRDGKRVNVMGEATP